MDRDSKGLFIKGNKVAHLAKGKPKPTIRRNFKTLFKAVIESYTEEEVIALIKELPSVQQLHYLDSFAKSQKDHSEKKAKLDFDKSKLDTSADVRTVYKITLPDDDSKTVIEQHTHITLSAEVVDDIESLDIESFTDDADDAEYTED